MNNKLFIVTLICLCLMSNIVYAIPYPKVAKRIYNIPYNKHTYNCLRKSVLYHELLKSKGIESRIVIGYLGKKTATRHAWVEYWEKGHWYLVDLTDNPRTWGFKSHLYRDYRRTKTWKLLNE